MVTDHACNGHAGNSPPPLTRVSGVKPGAWNTARLLAHHPAKNVSMEVTLQVEMPGRREGWNRIPVQHVSGPAPDWLFG